LTAQNRLGAGNWLVPYVTCAEPAYRMVCFPHAGGSASYYPWLRDAVPPEGELFCVQYPGRQERRREAAIEDFSLMVAALTEVLDSGSDVPLVLYGHSLGSLLAFETVRGLEARSVPVPGLIVSGRRAPSVGPPRGANPAADDRTVISIMRRLGGIDPALLDDPDVLELILPALRADFRLASTYVPEPGAVVSAPITVLNGNADTQVSPVDAEAWGRHTTSNCVTYQVEGGHFFFDTDRPTVIKLIRTTLEGLFPRLR